jgi:hypothetical protein
VTLSASGGQFEDHDADNKETDGDLNVRAVGDHHLFVGSQKNTHLPLEAIIAATSVMSLSSSLAGLWVARRAAGKAVGEAKDVIGNPVGKTTDGVGRTAGRVKKVAARQG